MVEIVMIITIIQYGRDCNDNNNNTNIHIYTHAYWAKYY